MSNKKFYILFSLVTVFLSFAYGVSIGIKNNISWAKSPIAIEPEIAPDKFDASEYALAEGISLQRVGDNISVNARSAQMFQLNLDRGIKQTLIEQDKAWQELGYKTFGKATNQSGVLMAVRKTEAEYMFMSLKKIGQEVVGNLTISNLKPAGARNGIIRNKLLEVLPEMPGSVPGAIMSSDDYRENTLSVSYTNPGPIEASVDFYVHMMMQKGWKAVNHYQEDTGIATLLFTPSGSSSVRSASLQLIISELPKMRMKNIVSPERTLVVAVYKRLG